MRYTAPKNHDKNTQTMAHWYSAVLVVRARVGDESPDGSLIDHQVRLIQAVDAEAAYVRALALGPSAQHSYPNAEGVRVSWEFVGLADLDEIQAADLEDGVEVYSWRGRGRAEDVVLPKEKLAVFWVQANRDRPVRDFLD
jgi:uncharacterized protein DUF4288